MIVPRKLPIGALFSWKDKYYRKGCGIIYVAHPGDPTITRAFLKRRKRRLRKRTK